MHNSLQGTRESAYGSSKNKKNLFAIRIERLGQVLGQAARLHEALGHGDSAAHAKGLAGDLDAGGGLCTASAAAV